jgi:hypothetical protein
VALTALAPVDLAPIQDHGHPRDVREGLAEVAVEVELVASDHDEPAGEASLQLGHAQPSLSA